MTSVRTPYQVLNLSPDAEPVVIEAAYRALIKKYHPDLWVDDPNAQRRAASINEAFATLRDPDAKAECDRKIRAWRNAVPIPPVHHVRPETRRGLLWSGWAVALLAGAAQLVPWQSLGTGGRASPPEASAQAPRAAAPDAAPQTKDPFADIDLSQPGARAKVGLPPLPPEPVRSPEALTSQPDIRRYVPNPQAEPRRTTAPRPARRPRPAPSRPTSEKDFLEREGYIY